MAKKLSASDVAARNFLDAAKAAGFTVFVTRGIVRIRATFKPNDKDAFTKLDMSYGSVLALAPLKGGSVWGTDGGGVGGAAALWEGVFTMNKSGTGARFLASLNKLIGSC